MMPDVYYSDQRISGMRLYYGDIPNADIPNLYRSEAPSAAIALFHNGGAWIAVAASEGIAAISTRNEDPLQEVLAALTDALKRQADEGARE